MHFKNNYLFMKKRQYVKYYLGIEFLVKLL